MPIDPADPGTEPAVTPPVPATPASALTPAVPEPVSAEEQMRRYEEELKNSDWGHQPC